MSKDDDDKRELKPSKLQLGSHEVGYGRPPAATRFVKGQSGNPAGRPRGSKNKPAQLGAYDLTQIILFEANREIPINEQGKVVTMPMTQAVIRRIAIDAMKGRPRAQELFMKIVERAQSLLIQLHERSMQAACEYKADWERELHRRARLGITHLPDPLPHPDDIVINLQSGEVEYHGPMTPEEEVHYENARMTLLTLRALLSDLDKKYVRLRNAEDRDANRLMAANAGILIAQIEAVLPAAYIARKGKAEAASQE